MRVYLFGLILILAACKQFPDVTSQTTEAALAADYPELKPFEQLKTDAEPSDIDIQQETQDVNDRVAALRARAADLQSE